MVHTHTTIMIGIVRTITGPTIQVTIMVIMTATIMDIVTVITHTGTYTMVTGIQGTQILITQLEDHRDTRLPVAIIQS